MISMTLQQAETFVVNCPFAEWDGWDLVLLKEDPSMMYSSHGIFRDGKWYKRNVIAAKEGYYNVSNNLGRFLKENRD